MSALMKVRLSILPLAIFLAATGISGCRQCSATTAVDLPASQIDAANRAKDYFDDGNYVEAEKIYEQIVAATPHSLYALSNLGVVRFRRGKFERAAEALQKAVAVAPNDEPSRCTLGITYYFLERYDDAIESLTSALTLKRNDSIAHYYLGMTCSKKGWADAAAKELEVADKLAPGLNSPPKASEKKFPEGLEWHQS